jgi:hypothetical protein
MSDVRDVHTQFEAVKVAMSQSKDGHILKLACHPNDTPEAIMRDPVGTRYMIVLVRMDDEGKPVASQQDEEGRKAVALAGTLCADDHFQQWLTINNEIDEANEQAASIWLRKYLGLTSRKELKHDAAARKKLLGVRDEFTEALRKGQLLR